MKFLRDLAHNIGKSTIRLQLLFIIATFLSIGFMGYYFGTFDQASHIPFLKKYIDSSLFPGDHFFALRFTHYSFFWFLFLPFYRLNFLEVSMFIVHLLTIYLTFWAIWKLSQTLFDNHLISFLSVLAFILPHMGFSGFTIVEFSLVNRTFVLPFLLIALDLYLRRKYYLSFFILGIMYNFHVISVNFILFMILFDYLLQFKRNGGWKTIIVGLTLFISGAAPVLIWKFGSSVTDLSLHWEWFSLISRGFLYHLFYPFSRYPHILFMTLGGISTIILFFITRRFAPSTKYNRSVTNFVYAILVILLIEVITALWIPLDIIIESQIMRASLFLTIFCYFYLASYIVKKFQSGKLKEVDLLLLTGALIFSLSPIVALAVLAIQNLIGRLTRRGAELFSFFIIIISFVAILIVAYQNNIWRPGLHIFAQRSTWYDAQLWAHNHTPKNAIFITPPYLWGLYDLDWRVISERSTVSTLPELLEAAFSPKYIDYWKTRFEAVAPGAINQFKGNTFNNLEITKKAFSRLTLPSLKYISNRFKASYLVVERPQQYLLPIVYKNQNYIIYSLKDL